MSGGREEVCQWLRSRAEENVSGIVVISGAGGIGKTTLVERALADVGPVWVRFDRRRHASPGMGLHVLLTALGEPHRASSAGAAAGSTDAPAGRDRIFDGLRQALSARPRPILVLDDIQWADELTLAWLAEAGETIAETRALVVSTVRAQAQLPTALTSALRQQRKANRVEHRRLHPLSVDDVVKAAGLAGVELDHAAAHRLHAATEGLPLAVQEVLQRVASGAVSTSTLDFAPAAAGNSVVDQLVRDDLDDLDGAARELIDLAAVAPLPVSEYVLRVAVDSPEEFDLAVAACEESGLLDRPQPSTLRFRHELYRESIYRAMPLARRRSLHRRIAAALVAVGGVGPSVIAAQLLDAGASNDALPLLEQAADAAVAAHDLGNAYAHLRTAVSVCPAERAGDRVRLMERAVALAIETADPRSAVMLIDELLSRDYEPALRGRLLVARARAATFMGDFPARLRDLVAARDAFEAGNDIVGVATSLGDLALPVASVLPLAEHISLGRQGLRIAEQSEDARTIARCAGNLAAAEIMSGNEAAFELWLQAVTVGSSAPGGEDEADRALSNWLQALLACARYPQATQLAHTLRSRRRGLATDTAYSAEMVVLWRTGRWGEVLSASAVGDRAPGDTLADHLAAGVLTMIAVERERRPDVKPLERAAQFMILDGQELWAPLLSAWLLHVRQQRREPRPDRGLERLLQTILASESVIGWEDLLPAAAHVNATAGSRVLELAERLPPHGVRGAAALAYAHALVITHTQPVEAERLLREAAEGYDELGEPYPAAHARVAAADACLRSGRRPGSLRVQAATTFRDLGADRSLAVLLRHAGSTSALDGFHVPASQRFAGMGGLTERERQVAEHARWGRTAREIAADLGIAASTVRTHLEQIKLKLGVRRSRDLVRVLGDDTANAL